MNENIMLVEDESITAMDIRRMLESSGFKVSATVSSGKEAVDKVQDINPDLIIMDIFLDDEIDGIEATDIIIKKLDVPIIYLTANTDPATIKRADMTRHYGYLLKPVSTNDLISILTSALQRHQLEMKKKERQRH